jgi:type II secretory pathway pseudopilin PulG
MGCQKLPLAAEKSLRSLPACKALKAFTLIELLVVMAIVMMIMGMAITSWFGIRRGAEMRRSVSTVQTTLMLARQQAVTKRQTVFVEFIQVGETNAMVVKVGTNQVHNQMFLSPGVKFNPLPAGVQFKPNGSAVGGGGSGMATISLVEKVVQGTPQTQNIDVWLLTGVTKVY